MRTLRGRSARALGPGQPALQRRGRPGPGQFRATHSLLHAGIHGEDIDQAGDFQDPAGLLPYTRILCRQGPEQHPYATLRAAGTARFLQMRTASAASRLRPAWRSRTGHQHAGTAHRWALRPFLDAWYPHHLATVGSSDRQPVPCRRPQPTAPPRPSRRRQHQSASGFPPGSAACVPG